MNFLSDQSLDGIQLSCPLLIGQCVEENLGMLTAISYQDLKDHSLSSNL